MEQLQAIRHADKTIASGDRVPVLRFHTMRALFITSLACVLMSVLAVLSLSTMTIFPRPGAESWRSQMMLVGGALIVGWLCLAFWVRPRQRTALPPQWLRQLLIVVGVVYALGVLLLVVG